MARQHSMMLPKILALLTAVAGQATAAFMIGHRVNDAYIETDSTAVIKRDYSASQGKLVVATRTLGMLTYTFLSPEFTSEPASDGPATDGLGQAAPMMASSTAVTVTATATETHHITVIATKTAAFSRPAQESGGLPFHLHGGGDYTSITFYGSYGTPTQTTSTTHVASTSEVPYHHSIDTSHHTTSTTPPATSSTTASTTASTAASTTAPTTASTTASTTAPTTSPTTASETPPAVTASSSPLSSSTVITSSPPESLLSSSLSSSTTRPKSATTLSGLTVPAGSATATESPKAAETHSRSGGSCTETALSTMLVFMTLAHIFAFY